jgi:hypothetical protein
MTCVVIDNLIFCGGKHGKYPVHTLSKEDEKCSEGRPPTSQKKDRREKGLRPAQAEKRKGWKMGSGL